MAYKLHSYIKGIEYGLYYAPKAVIEPTSMFIAPQCIKVGEGSYVGHEAMLIGYPVNGICIDIGPRCWIGPRVELGGHGGIEIRNDVGIGRGVSVCTSQHELDGHPKVMSNTVMFDPVRIEQYADIGEHAILLPGITIGEGAVVGAGSVVTKDVPAYEVWVGNPARYLKTRDVHAVGALAEAL